MTRTAVATGLVGILVFASGLPAAASEPQAEGLPSFGESAGCGALDGVGGPRMSVAGTVPFSEPVYGPWGDFFGRSIGAIHAQLVPVQLPGLDKDLYIHERTLPAFQLVLDNLAAEAAGGNSYPLTSYTWSWSNRTIPPGYKLSFHAAGTAIDVNSNTNPYSADNILITDMIDWGADNPYWFVDAWRNAGWCWGGDWQTIKDPMHYSWMGPIHTPGYDMSLYPPQPVAPESYSNYSNTLSSPEVGFDVVFDSGPAAGEPHFAVDMDANGAADVVRLRDGSGGSVILETARARHGYHWSTDRAETMVAPSEPSAPVTLADLSGDARADLVYLIEQSDGKLDLEVFALVQSGELTPSTTTTEVPAESGDVYLFDDYDLDGHTDLYVVRTGTPGTIEVWPGPAFDGMAVSTSVSGGLPGSSRYATGDRDQDGTADVYALSAAGALDIRTGATDFGAVGSIPAEILGLTDPTEQLFVDDLDGDGHPDLLLLDGEGQLRMRRGGRSTHAPGIWHQYLSHRVDRLAGPDRYATAAAISQAAHPDPSQVSKVFVATGESYPDALAGAVAAARDGAPLLLVRTGSVPPVIAAEITRLAPDEIIILGGESAVSSAVESALGGFASTTRLSGHSRYDTAVAVSQYAFPDSGSADQVIVATGMSYADAVTGAAAAGVLNGPVLLTNPTSLPGVVATEISRLSPARIVVLGGTAAVSSGVFTQLQGLASDVDRIAGPNRYETAVQMSQDAFAGGAPRIFVATGLNFPDALAGAAVAAYQGAPILLVPGTSLSGVVAAEIDRLGTYDVTLLGGTSVISTGVFEAIETMGF